MFSGDKSKRLCRVIAGLSGIVAAGIGGGVAEGDLIHVDEFEDFLPKHSHAA